MSLFVTRTSPTCLSELSQKLGRQLLASAVASKETNEGRVWKLTRSLACERLCSSSNKCSLSLRNLASRTKDREECNKFPWHGCEQALESIAAVVDGPQQQTAAFDSEQFEEVVLCFSSGKEARRRHWRKWVASVSSSSFLQSIYVEVIQ